MMDEERRWLEMWNDLAAAADPGDIEYIIVQFARWVVAEEKAAAE